MAVLTKQVGPQKYAAAANEFTFQAAELAGDSVVLTGREILLIQNGGAAPATFTIFSTPDKYGRTKDIAAQSLAAGEFAIFGPVPLEGWADSTRALLLDASAVDIKWAVITLHSA